MALAGSDLAASLRDAEEAVKAVDNWATRVTLARIRMDLAARGLAAEAPEFARWIKENPSLAPGMILVFYLRKNPELSAGIRAREDVRAATQAIADVLKHRTRQPWIRGWAWLETMVHESRESAREALRKDPTLLEACRLEFLLDKESPNDAIEVWLAAQANDEKALMESIAAHARAGGIFPQFFGK